MTAREVLVIDEAETMRRFVVDALTPAGYEVIAERLVAVVNRVVSRRRQRNGS
jgi:hypothetical protein